MVDAGARDLPGGLEPGRDRDPSALLSTDIFGAEQQLAMLLDQGVDQIDDWPWGDCLTSVGLMRGVRPKPDEPAPVLHRRPDRWLDSGVPLSVEIG
jgi:hypothetical protein